MFRERAFRSSFVVLGLILTAALLVAMALALSPLSRHRGAFGFWPGYLATFAGIWIVSFFACRAFPTYAGPDGLRGYNGMGAYYDVPWSAMRTVGKAPGYHLVRHGRWGTALSVPTFLADQKSFVAYVIEHAPEDNPLRRTFERSAKARR